VHVPDGKAGVERFKNEIFDAVLMDTQLPVLDGWEATRRIRQWEANLGRNPTPIVALTTHAQEEQFATGEASGFTGFLRKPLRKTTLLAALAKQIPQKNADHNDCVLPEEVQRLVPNYLEQKRGDLLRLWSAIKAADYATISTVGHQLKASGTSFGFIEFSEIGSAIERAGKSQDLGESRTQAELLEDSLSLLFAATSNTL
jgi:hypothetical protein